MQRELSPAEATRLRELSGIDRRTARRWDHWWVNDFTDTHFWKVARGQFMPPLDRHTLPLSLCTKFSIDLKHPEPDALARLLIFIRPLYDP